MSQSTLLKHRRHLACLLFLIGIVVGLHAESVQIGDLYYNLNTTDRTAKVTYENTTSSNYSSLPADVVIPATVKYHNVDFSVISITDQAFANCKVIQSISIPATVNTIGSVENREDYKPFYGCTSLKSIKFEDGSQPLKMGSYYKIDKFFGLISRDYGYGMFQDSPLEEVYLGRNIEYINLSDYSFERYPEKYGYSAFYNQPKLTKVTIGPQVTDIPQYLFYQNSSLTLMSLPNVKTIGKSAFELCSKLTTLNIGEALEVVGDRAFYGCSNVTKLTFPDAINKIGSEAFYDCTSVTEITVGSGLKEIGEKGFYNCGSFTALVLPSGFTTMGDAAFMNCRKLTIAQLGESLTAIPNQAFEECVSLSEMIVPATVQSIGDRAFFNDSGIATCSMQEGLKTIGHEVFYNNSGLTSMSIPGTVESIGRDAFVKCTNIRNFRFCDGDGTLTLQNDRSDYKDDKDRNLYYRYFYDCPITTMYVGKNIQYTYKTTDDTDAQEKSSSSEIYGSPLYKKSTLRSIRFGNKVTEVWDCMAFECPNLQKVTFGNSVKNIRSYAFYKSVKLPEVKFPQTLAVIGDYAFTQCIALPAVNFPGNLSSIGDNTFQNCTKLKDVIFEKIEGYSPALTIGNFSFAQCPSIESLTFPGRLKSIGNYTFQDNFSLATLVFEDSSDAVSLGYGATEKKGTGYYRRDGPLFGDCPLGSLYMGRNINYTAATYAGYSPFYNQRSLKDVRFSQAGTVTYCKDYLLSGVSSCKSMVLPESLSSIGYRSFERMTVLEGVTIPNNVSTIGTYAFTENKGLKFAKLSTGCEWLKEGLFADCDSLESITIPPVVTRMDTKMFRNCTSLATVTFEGRKELLTIGYGASQAEDGLFRDCPIETLNIDRWLSYNTDKPSRSPFYSVKTLKQINIGDNVKLIDKYMFSYCSGLEEVTLPEQIESVGLWGFRGCTSLKTIHFGNKISQISDYAFNGCTSLDNVAFPESMTSIADNSFSECTSLKTLDLGKKLMIIGPAAFKGDVALEGVDFPTTLYGLGVESFSGCTSLPSIEIKGISSVGKQAFQGCTGLKWVSLSAKTTSLGENSFAGCTGIGYVKSYAEFPPEGLANFPKDVVANGTLFAPEASMDDYEFSELWGPWLKKPLTEDVLVTSISLSQNEIAFRATETIQLTATVGEDNAVNKDVIWKSSDENIATVDKTGLVTAIAVGNAEIMAKAADGSGIRDICAVTVNPTAVESITLSQTAATLKKNRELSLEATILPATATVKELNWTSSDPTKATVDADGVVKTLLTGDVTITAAAKDDSGVAVTLALTVIAPSRGDSNDNDVVNVTDAVNTANYAVGKDVANFCFEAADVNNDKSITVADASGTISIIMTQTEVTANALACARAMASTEVEMDKLVIDDFNAAPGKTQSVFVKLDNTTDYVAIQADIVLPEGMELVAVKAGERTKAFHGLTSANIGDNAVRVALFDIENREFVASDEAILELVVKTSTSECGDIAIDNIIAADADANEYRLTSTGGHNNGVTDIDSIYAGGQIHIVAVKGGVEVYNAEGQTVRVFGIDGKLMHSEKAAGERLNVSLSNGIYIVTAGNAEQKIVVL
ncbi:leucine-rich repeat protein [Porphyromonas uenonis]|uniref:leucine-rich repeat protein n=1 Tax=Porphyromonas uenonis TaxID=281920 RepID=UPI0026738DBC|nr:leucine-rich repeat protein [Porphyromonas uenonis]